LVILILSYALHPLSEHSVVEKHTKTSKNIILPT